MTISVEGYDATLQRITLLAARVRRLEEAQTAAECQHLQRIATAYRAGVLSLDDLATAYQDFKAATGPGFSKRWNAAIPVSAGSIAAMLKGPGSTPNGPAGVWEGAFPFDDGAQPRRGTCVVYILFDSANAPCYVGSTQRFRYRLNRHAAEGKAFVFWRAQACADRDAAYQLEDQLLREHKPYLNKRAAA